MQVHQDIGYLPAFERCVLTIGTFDGVHLGHRQIIAQLKSEARRINGETVIITFNPHPRKIINSSKTPIQLLKTNEEKIELLEALDATDQRFGTVARADGDRNGGTRVFRVLPRRLDPPRERRRHPVRV